MKRKPRRQRLKMETVGASRSEIVRLLSNRGFSLEDKKDLRSAIDGASEVTQQQFKAHLSKLPKETRRKLIANAIRKDRQCR